MSLAPGLSPYGRTAESPHCPTAVLPRWTPLARHRPGALGSVLRGPFHEAAWERWKSTVLRRKPLKMIELEELGWSPGMKPSQRLRFAQLARPSRPSALAPYGSKDSPKKFTQPSLWACLEVKEDLRQDYRGLEDLWASSAELRAAWGLVFDVPRVHAASGDPHVAEGGPGDDPAAVPEAFPAGGDGSRGCHGLFPVSGQPLLHETSSEAVPDVVDGRVGPTPGHLCPGGLGRPREPVSVASAVGPGDGASCSRPASAGLCRLRFRADSSMAPGGAGYREHHPGDGVLSRTGPDPLPA